MVRAYESLKLNLFSLSDVYKKAIFVIFWLQIEPKESIFLQNKLILQLPHLNDLLGLQIHQVVHFIRQVPLFHGDHDVVPHGQLSSDSVGDLGAALQVRPAASGDVAVDLNYSYRK